MNGIGGRTIAEAKNNISVREFNQWVAYRRLRGSLVTSRRLEQTVARVCELICTAAGIKREEDKTPFTALDFMPHEDGYAARNRELTVEEFMKKAVAAGEHQ